MSKQVDTVQIFKNELNDLFEVFNSRSFIIKELKYDESVTSRNTSYLKTLVQNNEYKKLFDTTRSYFSATVLVAVAYGIYSAEQWRYNHDFFEKNDASFNDNFGKNGPLDYLKSKLEEIYKLEQPKIIIGKIIFERIEKLQNILLKNGDSVSDVDIELFAPILAAYAEIGSNMIYYKAYDLNNDNK